MIGSIPANGSSSRMKRGESVRARAISSRRRSPPESVSATAWARCESLKRSRRPSRGLLARRPAPREGLENREEVLDGGHLPEDGRFLREVPEAAPRARYIGSVVMSCPSRSTEPASGATSPTTIENVVVFPAPFGPSSPTTSPAETRTDTPATTVRPAVGLRRDRAPRGPARRRSRALRLEDRLGRHRARPSPRPPGSSSAGTSGRRRSSGFPFRRGPSPARPPASPPRSRGRQIAFVPSPRRCCARSSTTTAPRASVYSMVRSGARRMSVTSELIVKIPDVIVACPSRRTKRSSSRWMRTSPAALIVSLGRPPGGGRVPFTGVVSRRKNACTFCSARIVLAASSSSSVPHRRTFSFCQARTEPRENERRRRRRGASASRTPRRRGSSRRRRGSRRAPVRPRARTRPSPRRRRPGVSSRAFHESERAAIVPRSSR